MGYWETFLISTGVYIIFTLSLYIVVATGQLSIAQAGFFAIGAYVTSISCMILEIPLILSIIVGGVVSGLVGLLISFPLLRLTYFYFAIATLAFGEMVRAFFLNFYFTVSKSGLMIGPQGPIGFRFITYLSDHGITRTHFLLIVYAFVLIICLLFFALRRSTLDSIFKAVNEDPIKAGTLGINFVLVKIFAFTVGAILAGMAGGFFALFMTLIRADFFGFDLAFFGLLCLVFGGMETFYGAIIGPIVLTFLPEVARSVKDYRMMLYGILLIIVVIFSPRGLIHDDLLEKIKLFFKKEKARSK